MLFTAPELTKPGGVAFYIRTVAPLLPGFEQCIVGTRTRRTGSLRLVLRLAWDSLRFVALCALRHPKLIQLNPSLGDRALLRDGILLLISKTLGKRVLVFLHGWDVSCEQRLRGFLGWFFRSVYFQSDAFVVLAREFRDKLQAFGYQGPIHIETTAIPSPNYNALLNDGHRHEQFRILFLARVEREKGVYEAIDAYRIAKASQPQITLTVAGDGSELPLVKQYVARNRVAGVTFTGYVTGSSKQSLLNGSDCYLFPTFFGEGMPTTVLEAMAHGLPIITRSVGGLKDFFLDGRMGFITERKDPCVFAAFLELLAGDSAFCSRIATFNRTFALRYFCAEVVAQRISRIHGAAISGLDVSYNWSTSA